MYAHNLNIKTVQMHNELFLNKIAVFPDGGIEIIIDFILA